VNLAFARWTLPTRVTAIVAVLWIPLLGILLVLYAQLSSERRAAEIDNSVEVAQAFASTIDAFARDLEGTALAAGLALGQRPGPLDQAELGGYLRALSDGYGVLRGLFVVDPDGHVVASASGAGIGLDLSQRPYMQSLRQGAANVWAPGVRGLESGEITVTFGRAIRGPQGGLRGYLVAAFYPPALVDRLELTGERDLDLTLIDNQGLILHSTARPDLPFDQRDLSRSLGAARDQVIRLDGPTPSFSDEARYGASVPIPRTNWVLVASRPLGPLDARLRAQFLYQAGAMSAVVLLAAGLLALLTRNLVRPITELASVAAAIERGERPAIDDQSPGPEVAQLAAGMRSMSAAVADREDELRRQSARLDVLAGASQAFAAARLDRQALFDNIARWVAERIGDGCSVALLSDDERSLETVAMHHPQPDALARAWDFVRSAPTSVDEAPAVQTDAAARYGLHSLVSVPLRLQERVIGALRVWRDSPNRTYTPDDLALLQDIADRAALAIDNIRLYDVEQRAHATAEHLATIAQQIGASLAPEIVHEQIVRAATELLGSTFAGIFLLDHPDGDFVLGAAQGLATGQADAVRLPRTHSAAARAVAERQTILVDDARAVPEAALPRLLSGESVGSLVVAPMFAGAEPVGVVEVYSRVPPAFAPAAAWILASLAAPAAVAIVNARLHRDVQEQAGMHAALNRALREIAEARDRALREAEAAQAHLSELFMQAPAAIAVLRGPEHTVEFVNPRYQQLVGGRAVVGRAIRDALPELEGQGIFERLDSVYASGLPYLGNEISVDWERDAGASAEGYFNFVYQPYRAADGQVEGILVHAVDVTELVQARVRVELLAADRDAFVATASHDLKNPLTALTGTAQVLRRQLARSGAVTPERLGRALGTIEDTAAQMLELINEMLDQTRLRMGQELDLDRQPTDLVALVRRAAATHEQGTDKNRVVFEASPTEIVGEWDSARLRRVIGNLLSNAVKYSPAGGDVTVTATIENGCAVLRVRDHGVGIPEVDLPFVFDWYRRGSNVARQMKGSGIGLAGTKLIIDQHGGTITVDSREGAGCEFQVRLPLTAAVDMRNELPLADV
jgi:signal transduction histidine kinase